MGAYEICSACRRVVRALHSGGDAQIAEPGVCDACHQVAWAVWAKKEAARVEARIKAAIAADAPAIEADAAKAAPIVVAAAIKEVA
jgi:hypothetical protein